MFTHIFSSSVWPMIFLAALNSFPASSGLPSGSADTSTQLMPIKVDVMPHSVTGVCSTETVNTVSYAVASSPPGINGVFLLPESAYKSILSSLSNHQVAPIEAYPSLSCNTTDPVTRCRKYTLPDEVLSDRVNHCVMLRNEQSVSISANVLVSWDNSTSLGSITAPPAPEKAAIRMNLHALLILPGLAVTLLLFNVGLIQLTDATSQRLPVRPNTLATVCSQSPSVDVRYQVNITALDATSPKPSGANGIFIMKSTDLSRYQQLIASGNTTAKVVGYSGLSCDQPTVPSCARGTDARRKIVESNIYPCLVIRNRGSTAFQALISIEFDAVTPLANPLTANPQAAPSAQGTGGSAAATGAPGAAGTTATSAQAGKGADGGTSDFFSSSAARSLPIPLDMTTPAALLLTWATVGTMVI
ncbi:hypothetical protein BJ684DRAFT_20051 [Piptocephalis cylindrospora]|uniref:Uncharacterized protein n=1 Tax=Piptocephalis cylindrospora TaxID=1907219 RepID=A0A4P9Y3R9_9FUNG|nr:hypothetical protein BJ684DRAFT_20051 [Piptocephalis cylindrospora]|eukprot:RKP13463.1 hypothetical protein BJ684DRAFT_20051 [Piptocephalis cylindrospora]